MKRERTMKMSLFDPKKSTQYLGYDISEKLDGNHAIYVPQSEGLFIRNVPFANIAKRPNLGGKISTGLWSRQWTPLFPDPAWCAKWLHVLDPGYIYAGEVYDTSLELVGSQCRSYDKVWSASLNIFDIVPVEHFADGYVGDIELVGVEAWLKTRGWHGGSLGVQDLDCGVKPIASFNSIRQVDGILKDIIDNGGEGVVIRHPLAAYVSHKSKKVLKYKPYMDAEATIVGFTEGLGRNAGRLGALQVSMDGVKRFGVSGMTDELRSASIQAGTVQCDNFSIGDIITFKYRKIGAGGVPVEASFKSKRDRA